MRIPIRKRGREEIVGEVVFSNTGELTAIGTIQKVDGTVDELRIIRETIIKFGRWNVVFVYTEKGHVGIWRGFWGWLAGLRMVLPSIGYEIAAAQIEWPVQRG